MAAEKGKPSHPSLPSDGSERTEETGSLVIHFTAADLGRSEKQAAIVERRAKVRELKAAGCSAAEIARRLGISYKSATIDVRRVKATPPAE